MKHEDRFQPYREFSLLANAFWFLFAAILVVAVVAAVLILLPGCSTSGSKLGVGTITGLYATSYGSTGQESSEPPLDNLLRVTYRSPNGYLEVVYVKAGPVSRSGDGWVVSDGTLFITEYYRADFGPLNSPGYRRYDETLVLSAGTAWTIQSDYR